MDSRIKSFVRFILVTAAFLTFCSVSAFAKETAENDVASYLGKTFREVQQKHPEIEETSFSNQMVIYGDPEGEVSFIASYDCLTGVLDNVICGIQLNEMPENDKSSYSIYGITCGLVDSDVNSILYQKGYTEVYSEDENKGWVTAHLDEDGHMIFAHYSEFGYLNSLYLRDATEEELKKYQN